MQKLNFLKTLIAGVALAAAHCPQAFAEITKQDILKQLFNGSGTKYINDDGTKVSFEYYWIHDIPQYYFIRSDLYPNYHWTHANITINGSSAFENSANSNNEQTYDFDENGKLQAIYNCNYSGYGCHGELLNTYQYAEDGQMLVYNPQGELVGAYNNFYDKLIADSGYYDKADELKHLSDGNYTAKDANNNVLGVYYQNGDYSKNTYNSEGNLISSNKYDKDGNLLESSINKYDGAGNLTAAYKNGVATYKRTSYTPAEAAKAVKKGNNNKITFTFK